MRMKMMPRMNLRAIAVVIASMSLLAGPSPTSAVAADFVRGDVDLSGRVNLTDAIQTARFQFLGAEAGDFMCRDAMDIDDNGSLEITDATVLLSYLFLSGLPVPPPFPECGEDPTDDMLDCGQFPSCVAESKVFVIDRSSSGRLGVYIANVREKIASLDENDQLAIVAFDRLPRVFPAESTPLFATPENRQAANAFLDATGFGSGTCGKEALLLALDYSLLSVADEHQVLFMTDGYMNCPGENFEAYVESILIEVTEKNDNTARIDCFHSADESVNREFFEALSGANGGGVFAIGVETGE